MMQTLPRRAIRNPWAYMALGLLLTLLVYAPGLSGTWLFDDFPNIVDNAGVHVEHWSLPALTNAALASPSSEFKRPLASLSFALNYVTTGANPQAMKATNLAIHLLNGIAAFFFLRSLLAAIGSSDKSGASRRAAIMASAWMLLPINLTSVLYVVQRMESMANLAVLLGLWAYVAGRRRTLVGGRGFPLAAGGVLLATVGGVMAKETAILLPLYAALVEIFVFRGRLRQDEDKPRDRLVVAFFIVFLAIPFVAGSVWLAPSLLNPETWATRNFTLRTRLLSEARIVVDYIGWTLVPTPRALSFYHDDFVISQGFLAPFSTALSVAALTILAIAAGWLRRRLPAVGLGLALYLACHTLTGTVLPLELIYEHRNYFASLGLVTALVSAIDAMPRRLGAARLAAIAGFTAIVLLWAGLTWRTADAWGDPVALARELAARAPDSPRAQYELGRTYIIAGNYDKTSPYVALSYEPLERAAALPGSSILPEQALIFMNSRMGLLVKDEWWRSIEDKLRRSPPTIQDESSLDALSKCLGQGGCKFDPKRLFSAFEAALSQPRPSPRLLAMYASFAWEVLHDVDLAYRVQLEAVAGAPREGAYRITLGRLAVQRGDLATAREQMLALSAMNVGGRFNGDIGALDAAIARATSTP